MLNGTLNWAFILLGMGLCIILWRACYKYSWGRVSVIPTTLMMFGSMAVFEAYFLTTGKVPWFFGLEKTFQERTDAGPAFFLILLGIITWYLVAWMLPKLSKRWNESKHMPGNISTMTVSTIGLLLLLFFSGSASANVCHTYGFSWGITVVNTAGNICSDVAELAQSENDRLQERSDELLTKAERRAPVQEHRHTNTRSRGR